MSAVLIAAWHGLGDNVYLRPCVERLVFLCLPLFTGPEHVLRSKHFRPDEHYWYWTYEGLLWWMGEHGFTCIEHGTPESLLGREDIHTFVFNRRKYARSVL